jgi:DNA-binding response OmpR family regulator
MEFPPSFLFRILEEVIYPWGEATMRSHTIGTAITICIVEADAAIGEFLLEVLHLRGQYSTLLFNNEFQVLQAVAHIRPHLFILDSSPEVNGIALYDRLHALEAFADVPALILSTRLYSVEHELNERKLTGMGKPFDCDEFLETVARVIAGTAAPKELSRAGTG